MEGVLIAILILGFLIINSNINSKFRGIEKTIDDLNDKINAKFGRLENTLDDLNKRINLLHKTTPPPNNSIKEEKKEQVIIKEPIQKEAVSPEPILKKEPPIIIAEEKAAPEIIKPIIEEEVVSLEISFSDEEKQQKPIKEQKIQEPVKPWLERFKEKNPDLEKFIGENLINKIGILILVLGISFFVKYAIDKDWINEPARVGIGVLCGALIMTIAHKLKKNYASFSSVLIAGAISIFYFTIFIAFHEYQLFSQTVAFIIMAVITAFSALVSISYNRQELAVLSLIGGFAAPFMLSTGEGNYVVLFSYITVLNIGILAISYFKKWKIVTILSFVLTLLLFGGWCLTKIGSPDFSHKGALTFATIFYFIFSITIVLNNLKNKGIFSTIEYFILVANTFFFFGIGMAILRDWDSNFTGFFTLLLAVYNVIYAAVLFKKFGLDKNAIYLLIGLALTFVTLTIPIQFEGNLITIFWAAEVVLLFWLSQKSKISSFKLGAIIIQVLMVISLLMDWQLYVYEEALPIVFNHLFISGLMVSSSFFLVYWLLKNEETVSTKYFSIGINVYKGIVLVLAFIISYFTGILEVDYQAYQFLENDASALSFSVTYHFIFVAIFFFVASILKRDAITKGVLGISIVSIIAYIVHFYKLPKNEIINNYTFGLTSNYAFIFHYIILACLAYFGYQLLKKTHSLFNVKPEQSKWLPWVFVFAIVYILSNEIMTHGLQFSDTVDTVTLAEKFSEVEEGTNYYYKKQFVKEQLNTVQTQIIKIGYPILWGVFSFIFLIIGIRKQWKVLRIIALSLLGVTIAKLFLYDIKNVSETGKIIAFILLGVLILVISFVYQKLKKLVVEETTENNTENEEA